MDTTATRELRRIPSRDVTALALLGAAVLTWRWVQFARCLKVGDEHGSPTE